MGLEIGSAGADADENPPIGTGSIVGSALEAFLFAQAASWGSDWGGEPFRL